MAKYTVDYTQDADGRWSAAIRHEADTETRERTPSRLEMVDCVGDVYAAVGDDAELEVGDVREYPGAGL